MSRRRVNRARPPVPAARPRPRGVRAIATWAGAGVLVAVAAIAVVRVVPSPVRRERGLNVLLVTVDTLRADALGAYGNRRAATPWIDRLAADGVLFRGAHSHNVVTLPSHANILSGRYPFEHGVRDNAGFRFAPGTSTLAGRLRAQGYRTAAFVSAFTLDSRFGLDQGFEVYEDGFTDGAGAAPFVLPERRGADTVALARRWIEAQGAGPFFAWVHLYDPHAPYRPPEPFAARFPADPYAGEVAAADAALEPLLSPLLGAGREGRTLVVLTADHGESLGEHGERTHGIFAYEGTLHVPLVLFAPRLLRHRVVDEPVGHVDVVPTVLDALGLPVAGDLSGRSLLSLAAGHGAPPRPTYFEALSGQTTRGWAPLHGVLRDGVKYIDLPLAELYDLGDDPREERNLVARRPRPVDELRAVLSGFRARDRGIGRSEESADTRERLRALGYVAAAAPVRERYTEEDDPKRLIGLDALIEEVIARHRAGDVAGALALCEDVVRRRPQMPATLLQLGLLRRKAGQLEAAIEALRRAFSLTPDDAGTAALLGAYLNEAGQAAETARLLEPYAQRADPQLDVLVNRGVALAQLGRRGEALASFERARQVDPSSAMVLVQAATVHLLAGDDEKARAALRSALELNPDLALAHHTLGLIAARRGEDEEAVRCFERALALEPAQYDTLLNLGSLLARRGRRDEARGYLERFVQGAPEAVYAKPLAAARAWLRRSS